VGAYTNNDHEAKTDQQLKLVCKRYHQGTRKYISRVSLLSQTDPWAYSRRSRHCEIISSLDWQASWMIMPHGMVAGRRHIKRFWQCKAETSRTKQPS